jgi:4-hydroxy-tetrahydrodipicolinate synthase
MQGLLVPQLTAFDKNNNVDYSATLEHGKWLLSNGVSGLVPFGTFGEGASLSLRERMKITEDIAGISNNSFLVPAVISNSLGDIWEYLDFLKDIPVDAVMITPPNYFRPIDNQSMIDFFKAVASRTHHKIVAYNIPACSLKIETEVAKNIPIWGVKDSSGDINSAISYLENGVRVLLGSDILLAKGIAAGASGGICGLANFFPKQMSQVYSLAASGNLEAAEVLVKETVGLFDHVLKPDFATVTAIGCLKNMAATIIPTKVGKMRLPCPTWQPSEKEISDLTEAVRNFQALHN